MYTKRALCYYTSNRLMLTNLAWRGATLRYWDCTIDTLGVLTQKAEVIHSKILKIRLCNVQLFFPRVWTLEISRKAFRISLSGSCSVWKQFLDICIRLQTQYPVGYQTRKPDSYHLWTVDDKMDADFSFDLRQCFPISLASAPFLENKLLSPLLRLAHISTHFFRAFHYNLVKR